MTRDKTDKRGKPEKRADAGTPDALVPRRRLGIILTLLFLLPAAGHVVYFHFAVPVLPYDDAFIGYRYVDNALAGRGLVYNEGERVMGCTSPLHLGWVAGWKTVLPGVETPTLAVRSNLIPYLATAAAIYLIALRAGAGALWSPALAFVFLTQQHMLRISSGGMESFLFTAFAGFSLVAIADRRAVLTGALIGLAMLTRPEAIVLVPLAVIRFAREPRRLLACAAVCAIPVAAWVAFAWAYFGTPVPHSIVAKSIPVFPLAPGHAYGNVAKCTVRWMTDVGAVPLVFDNPLTRAIGVAEVFRGHAPFVVVVLALAAAWFPAVRRSGAYRPGVAYGLCVALYARGNPMLFEWYLPALFVLGLLGVALPLIGLGALLKTRLAVTAAARPRLLHRGVMAARLVGIVWLGFVAMADLTLSKRFWTAYVAEEEPTRVRIIAYRTAAQAMNGHLKPGDRVAASEIGALGYYLNARILDGVGLVSPKALPFHPVPRDQRPGPGFGMIPGGLVETERPEWIVSMPTFADLSLFRRPWFDAAYAPWAAVSLPEPLWGSSEILIYRRRQ